MLVKTILLGILGILVTNGKVIMDEKMNRQSAKDLKMFVT